MDLARRRLSKELLDISKSKELDILLRTDGDDLYKWTGYIKGPPDSPYQDGWFKLKFEVGANYP